MVVARCDGAGNLVRAWRRDRARRRPARGPPILATDAPLAAANLVAGVVYALTLPFVALTTVYVYADVRVRGVEEDEAPDVLPAELALGGHR